MLVCLRKSYASQFTHESHYVKYSGATVILSARVKKVDLFWSHTY